jgi:hypothetical protein
MEVIRDILYGGSAEHPIPPMDGALSPNSRLDELEALDFGLSAPDDVAADGNGRLLVSSELSLLALDGNDRPRPVATFDSPISALARLRDGSWVVGLDGNGLVHLDSQGRPLHTAATLEGHPLTGITAAASDGGQGVYFTIGSTRHHAADWVRDLMECNRDGLLGHWIPGRDPQCLLRDLAFANGVSMEDDGRHLVITESWSHSVSRYEIQGSVLGEKQTLIGNLPGYPSRISAARGGGYWLAVFAMRTQLVELVLQDHAFKQDMMRSLAPELWIRPALSSTGSHLEPLQMGGVRRLGIRKAWAPPRSYGLVLRVDNSGEITDSLHSRVGGHCHGVTAAREIDGRLLVVSRGGNRLLAAPVKQLVGDPE